MAHKKTKKSEGARRAKVEDFIYSTNPFAFIYSDANLFQEKAQKARNGNLEATYARTAVLLMVLAAEALINRVLDCFARESVPGFVKDKISQLPLDMKWYMAPLLCGDETHCTTYPVDREPFQSFGELIRIRNSCVHPSPRKHPVTILEFTLTRFHFSTAQPLTWPQTKIARDVGWMDKTCASKARRVVDQMIDLLDEFLGGRIKRKDWWMTESFTPVREAQKIQTRT